MKAATGRVGTDSCSQAKHAVVACLPSKICEKYLLVMHAAGLANTDVQQLLACWAEKVTDASTLSSKDSKLALPLPVRSQHPVAMHQHLRRENTTQSPGCQPPHLTQHTCASRQQHQQEHWCTPGSRTAAVVQITPSQFATTSGGTCIHSAWRTGGPRERTKSLTLTYPCQHSS